MCNSCVSLAGLVLNFIACFILLVIAPLVPRTKPARRAPHASPARNPHRVVPHKHETHITSVYRVAVSAAGGRCSAATDTGRSADQRGDKSAPSRICLLAVCTPSPGSGSYSRARADADGSEFLGNRLIPQKRKRLNRWSQKVALNTVCTGWSNKNGATLHFPQYLENDQRYLHDFLHTSRLVYTEYVYLHQI